MSGLIMAGGAAEAVRKMGSSDSTPAAAPAPAASAAAPAAMNENRGGQRRGPMSYGTNMLAKKPSDETKLATRKLMAE